jgi:hypothetical protein
MIFAIVGMQGQRLAGRVWANIAATIKSQPQRVRRATLHFDCFGRTGIRRKAGSTPGPTGRGGSAHKQEAFFS